MMAASDGTGGESVGWCDGGVVSGAVCPGNVIW